MSRHQRRKQPAVVGFKTLRRGLSRLRANPLRAACFGGLGLVLFWLVLSRSLPYALALSAPNLALALNPNNPAALIANAEHFRSELLKAKSLEPIDVDENSSEEGTLPDLPEAKSGSIPEFKATVDEMRWRIRRLAARAIASDPLNAAAFRLIGEATADGPERVRFFMREALKRSRRDANALFWLLNDRTYYKDFGAAVDHADMLLRTNPELSVYVTRYLAQIAEEPEGIPFLVQKLAEEPKETKRQKKTGERGWRASFFKALPRYIKNEETPLKLMIALKGTGNPAHNKELAAYLNVLINENRIEAAYNAWIQLLPKAELNTLGLLYHSNFEQDPDPDFEQDPDEQDPDPDPALQQNPSGLPFDWKVDRGANSVAEFVPLGDRGERAFHMTFGVGHIKFPELSQVILLPPGRYRLEGKLRGSITAKRGLRWQLRCMDRAHRSLGKTEMLLGLSEQWRVFTLEADVPEDEGCRAQMLRLFNDSRSPLEDYISGEVWVTGVHLERVLEPRVVCSVAKGLVTSIITGIPWPWSHPTLVNSPQITYNYCL